MKKLGILSILNKEIKAYLAKPSELDPEDYLVENDGCYDGTALRIYINRESSTSPARVQDTIVHEAIHALLELTGVRNVLQRQLGLEEQKYEDFEETLVRMLTPAVVSMMPSLLKISNLSAVKRAIKTPKVTE